MKSYQITDWCHQFLSQQVQPGDLCIDATMGNGHDTLFLSQLTGETGRVLAFDIQQQALDSTQSLLHQHAHTDNVTLILDSHSNLSDYVKPETVSCIVFNFGYLPCADHKISTHKETSIPAIEQGLESLKAGGLMSLCIYSGGDSGFDERDAILEYLRTLDTRRYLVILSYYYNRPNHPPIPVLIQKLRGSHR